VIGEGGGVEQTGIVSWLHRDLGDGRGWEVIIEGRGKQFEERA
jgi:hypothetical protein